MKEKDMKFFAVAKELSKCSDFDRIKVGAVICDNAMRDSIFEYELSNETDGSA